MCSRIQRASPTPAAAPQDPIEVGRYRRARFRGAQATPFGLISELGGYCEAPNCLATAVAEAGAAALLRIAWVVALGVGERVIIKMTVGAARHLARASGAR